MGPKRRLITGLLTSAALSAALAGCGGDPQPQFAPPASVTPSTSAPVTSPPRTGGPGPTKSSDALTPPSISFQAKQATTAGATAFVKYYWAVADYAQSSGSTDLLETLGSRTCAGCSGAVNYVRQVYDGGGSMTGGQTKVVGLRVVPLSVREIDINIMEAKFRIYNMPQVIKRPGKATVHLDSAITPVTFNLTYANGNWAVDVFEVSA